MPETQVDTRYIKRYTKGQYDLRFAKDVGKFACQIYVENRREDVLTHDSLTELEAKVERYLAGEAQSGELKSLKDQLVKAREEVASLTKSLTSIGDGNAKAAQLEKELEKLQEKLRENEKKLAQAEADIEQYKNDIDALKSVKKTEKSK